MITSAADIGEETEMELSIKIDVPYKLQRFLQNPNSRVSEIMKEADKEVLELLRSEISANAPKKRGQLAGSITVDLEKRKVFSPLVYARAVELGHYATPKYGSFLKFYSEKLGRDVFLKFVRTKKQPYFFKTYNANRLKIRDIYDKAFERLP